MPKNLRTRIGDNAKPNPHATPPGQVWEALTAKLGRKEFGLLVDGMKRVARTRKGQ